MSEIKKIPYEISIWDDVLTYNITYLDGEKETVNVIKLPNTSGRGYKTNYQFFDEQKVAVIGSDIMEAPTRAHNPIFTRKINGAVELTFTVYNHIYDSESGEYIDNPFAKLLTNERKIKLRYDEPNVDDPWHDLIIKNIQESSDNKTYTYTATSLIVNELSKNGYDLEFDNELMNNQGTVVELAEKIVDGSDWVVGKSDSLQQRIEEPLYAATLATKAKAYNLATPGDSIDISANTKVYIFYSYVAEKKTENVQFILQSNVPTNVSTQVLDISDVYLIESVDWSKTFKDITFYPDHRAKRFEYRQKTKYDDVTGRIVSVYKKGGVEYYGYKETKYISPTYVRNLIANGKDFSSTAGWDYFGDSIGEANIDVTYNPPISDENWTAATPYLDLRFTKKVSITNEGIYSNRNYLNTLTPGQKFVLRLKTLKTIPKYVKFFIKSYDGETTFVKFSADSTLSKDGFTYYAGTYSDDGVSEADFASEIPTLFIGLDSEAAATAANIMIEEIELFEYIEIDDALIYPGQITGQELIIQDNYYFYKAGAYDSIEKIKYAYKGLTKPSDFKPVFNAAIADKNSSGNFEKVRSIVGKESNRYNLIQNLCETFECWADFKVEHNPETGKILLDRSKGFPRQKKTIYFREAVGHHNYAGFRYGVNLKSIQRTLDSNQLASKVIVSNNSNELARDGFCSIARASENPTLENFILCFDYYTQHLLLDNGTITSDLYDGTLTNQKYIGYFPNLLSLNKQRDALIEENAAITAERSSIEAEVQTLALLEQENNQLALSYDAMLANNSGYTFKQFTDADIFKKIPDSVKKNTENKNYIQQIKQYKKIAENAKNNKAKVEQSLANINSRQEQIEKALEEIRTSKDALNKEFYTKYSRFIQEGTWISEDYIDDNLYYLDAYSVARTSAFPKVTYTINVMSLEGNEEYRGYSFNVGDISYIEDVEFFGYYYSDGIKTPYHEEVVVSERVDNLDSPENNQIHVQNYKTQFEDLFQRIEATSQAVEYSSGTIAKVSNVINEDGSIKVDILQNSISNNSLIIKNAKDQSVTWGDQGITITNLSKPHEVVRLVSGGIMLSTDGGRTYSTGITANGINANYITSGQLDTSVLVIRNGSFPSFRWDKNGISAYKYDGANYNYEQYIRYDQYGLYGTKAEITFDKDSTWDSRLETIRKAADFSVTWDGFRIKSDGTNGYIDISSDQDIRVVVGEQTRVKLGQIASGKYGLKIFNAAGESVLETNDNGNLTLSNIMTIASSNGTTVRIGSLDADNVDGTENTPVLKKVFEAYSTTEGVRNKQDFVIFEDGSFRGTKAYVQGIIVAETGSTFTGRIEANEGTIGGLNIANISNLTGVRIVPKNGTIFKKKDTTVSPTQLTFEVNLGSTPTNGTYQWYGGTDLDNLAKINNATGNVYNLATNSIKDNDFYFIKVEYQVEVKTSETTTDTKTYQDVVAISRVMDGEKGAPGDARDAYTYELSQPEFLKFVESGDEQDVITMSPETMTVYLFENEKELFLENLDNVRISFLSTGGDYDYSNNTDTFSQIMSLEGIEGNKRLTITLDKEIFALEDSNGLIKTIKSAELGYFLLEVPVSGTESGSYTLKIAISIKFGVSEEAARFNILATGIKASIQEAGLEFNSNGLTITNSGFFIKTLSSTTNQLENVFYVKDNVLYMKGNVYADNGYFNGEVHATSGSFVGSVTATDGSFTGSINASSGKIAGFTIDGDSLVAENYNQIDYNKDTLTPDGRYFIINDDNTYEKISLFTEVQFSEGESFIADRVYYEYDDKTQKYSKVDIENATPLLNTTYYLLQEKTFLNNKTLYQSIPKLTLTGGTDGSIDANKINLGIGAHINEYIQLGNNAWLYNPDIPANNGAVLKAGATLIDNKGHINLTAATGAQGRWKIDEYGKAIFDEIHANYAEIGVSVLKVNTIQAAGSTMVFKASYSVIETKSEKINDQTYLSIQLDETFDVPVLKSNDYVMITCGTSSKKAIVTNTPSEKPYTYLLQGAFEDADEGVNEAQPYTPGETALMLLGNLTDESADNHIFAISSDKVTVNNSATSFYHSNSLTLSQLTKSKTDGSPIFEKKLVLGKLENLGSDITGYGLYAENAFLYGSLTTKSAEGSYAGINTTHDVTITQFGAKDESRIVFWAGAADSTASSIQEAPFQVSEKGSIYASNGVFSGSLVSHSYIEASKIFASEVRPLKGGIPSLKIYDVFHNENNQVPGGIWFMNGGGQRDQENEDPCIALNSGGFYAFGFYKPQDNTSGAQVNAFKFVDITKQESTSGDGAGTEALVKLFGHKVAGTIITTDIIDDSETEVAAVVDNSYLVLEGKYIKSVYNKNSETLRLNLGNTATTLYGPEIEVDSSDAELELAEQIKISNKTILSKANNITLDATITTFKKQIYFDEHMRYEPHFITQNGQEVKSGYDLYVL